MGTPPIRPFVDKALDGQLDARLIAWREEGLSYNRIASELAELVGYRPTAETIRVWFNDLAVPAERAS